MSTAVIPEQQAVPCFGQELYRFTVPQYLKLAGEGFFGPDARTELIEGLVVTRKMARNPPHDGTVGYLNRWLVRVLPDPWVPRCQLALVLARSAPEPDLAVVRGPMEKYFHRHPRAADALLAIEVSEDSLAGDRLQKGPMYAAARIPEYWIVNVVDLQVEVYTQPRGGKAPGYRHRQDYSGRTRVPLVLDGREIAQLAVVDIFGGLLRAEQNG